MTRTMHTIRMMHATHMTHTTSENPADTSAPRATRPLACSAARATGDMDAHAAAETPAHGWLRPQHAFVAVGLAGAALSLALLSGCAGQNAPNTPAGDATPGATASANGGDVADSEAPSADSELTSADWDAPAPAIDGADGNTNVPDESGAADVSDAGAVDSTAFIPDDSTQIERFDEVDSAAGDGEASLAGATDAQPAGKDLQRAASSQADRSAASSARGVASSGAPDASAPDAVGTTSVAFRPADTGVQPEETLRYPYLGLTATLPQALQDAMESREMFVLPTDTYTDDARHIRYATLAFCPLTDEQRTREVASLDSQAWEAELQRAGVLGVYAREFEDRLDELTGCDSHTKLGESPDGAYLYYLSTNSQAPREALDLLSGLKVSISEMRALDPIESFSAFSAGRTEGVETVGSWEAVDIDGQAHRSDELFGSAKLTLVNVMATWCTACVMEMPDLKKLQETMDERGMDVNVVAVVLDTVDEEGQPDEYALEQARRLRDLAHAPFPFLAPDASEMNGRLSGIEGLPESFFVDSEGRIVGKTYSGARSTREWLDVVERELAQLEE